MALKVFAPGANNPIPGRVIRCIQILGFKLTEIEHELELMA